MPISIANLNPTFDTFQSWVERTNQIADGMSTFVMTSAANTSGGQNSANVYLDGIFAGNTIATSTLRGGTVEQAGNLSVTSNTTFVGSNLSSNTTYLNLSSTVGKLTTTTLTLEGTTVAITSNLNVKSNTLVVSTTGRVGINTTATSAALEVGGAAVLNGNVTVSNILSVTGNTTLTGNVVSITAPNTYITSNNVTATGNAAVTGSIVIGGVIGVVGSANVGGTLGVVGDTTFTANVSANNLSLNRALPISSGGTGANTASAARTNLGLGSIAVLNTITSSQFTGTTTLSILDSAGSTLKTLYASAT